MTLFKLIIIITLAINCIIQNANAYCIEPNSQPPYCTSSPLRHEFQNQWEFDTCKRDVERYLQELQTWANCTSAEASERAENAIKALKCKAEKKDLCF